MRGHHFLARVAALGETDMAGEVIVEILRYVFPGGRRFKPRAAGFDLQPVPVACCAVYQLCCQRVPQI